VSTDPLARVFPVIDTYRNRSASGGVNTFLYPFDIADDEAVELRNVDIGTPGVRSIRQGISLIASGATFGPPLVLQEYMGATFQSELLMVTPGAQYPAAGHLQLWSWKGNTTTWTRIATLTGFTSATMPVEILPGLDLNASGGPAVARISTKDAVPHAYVYNGSGITMCTGTPCMPSLGAFPTAYHLNRGYAGGRDTTARGKVHYSDSVSYTVTGWAPTQSMTMGGGNRQEIVALKTFRSDNLVVFMQDRIEMLSNTDQPLSLTGGTIRTVVDAAIGCGARRSICTMGEDIFFLDQHFSVRSLAKTITDNLQGAKTLPVSIKIQTWIDRINPAASEAICAVPFDRFYVLGLPIDSATVADHVFVYDRVNDSWTGPWDGGWAPWSMAVATLNAASNSADTHPRLYLGSGNFTGAMVYRTYEGHDDAGAPIVYQETGKRINADQLEAKKLFRRLKDFYAATSTATMQIEASVNGGAFQQVGYVGLAGALDTLPATLPFDFSGIGLIDTTKDLEQFNHVNDIQFRWTCTANVDIQHVGYSMLFHRKAMDWTQDP
jgi:hypothetical protein